MCVIWGGGGASFVSLSGAAPLLEVSLEVGSCFSSKEKPEQSATVGC